MKTIKYKEAGFKEWLECYWYIIRFMVHEVLKLVNRLINYRIWPKNNIPEI